MASSRIRGLSPQTTTFGAPGFGRSYTSLATWENDTDNDNVTLQVSPELVCYPDSASYDLSIVMAGATNNASYFRSIVAVEGSKHRGLPNQGVWFIISSDVIGFQVNEGNSSIQDIGVTLTSSSANTRYCFSNGSGSGASFVGCFAYNSNNAGAGAPGGFQILGTNCIIVNSAAIKNEGIGIRLGGTGTGAIVYNNSIIQNTSTGILLASGASITCINNLVSGNSSNYSSAGTVTASYNGSSDATIFGSTGVRTSQDYSTSFVNSAGDDFRLSRSDAAAKDFGTDLSADGLFPFDDDIKGHDRHSIWSMGWDEPSAIPISVAQRHRAMQGLV